MRIIFLLLIITPLGSTAYLEDGEFKNAPNCEDRERGDMCYLMRETPYQHRKCPLAYCNYQPTTAYIGETEYEIKNPPRILTETCKYPEYPCYTTSYSPAHYSTRIWCPLLKCDYEEKREEVVEGVRVKINGKWKRRRATIRVPSGCACQPAPCNDECKARPIGVYGLYI